MSYKSLIVPTIYLQRRSFLGQAVLSAGAIALLSGCGSLTRSAVAADPEQDVRILDTALAAEHEAVAAYQLGADSGLLQAEVRALALQFQGHHKAHVDLLTDTIRTLGGIPSAPRTDYAFPVEQLKSQSDVLAFASELEQGAVSAYLGAVPLFEDRELARAAASILGDEAMHWAVLRQALGQDPVPVAFVS